MTAETLLDQKKTKPKTRYVTITARELQQGMTIRDERRNSHGNIKVRKMDYCNEKFPHMGTHVNETMCFNPGAEIEIVVTVHE